MTAIPRTMTLALLAVLGAAGLAAFAVILRGGEFDDTERVWRSNTEWLAKGVLSAAAVTLAVLIVASLRLQTPITGRPAARLYLGMSALIVATMLVALALLWSWDALFIDGSEGSENVANVAQRALLALFSLSVVGYLATPLLARLLPPEPAGSPR